MSSSGSSDDSDDDFAAELEATMANDGDDGGDAKRARTGDAPSSSIATREDAKTNDDDVDDACPPHPAFMFDICVRCGKRREKGDDDASGGGGGAGGGDKSTSMRYIHEGLELSASELEKAKREEKRRVLTSGKLLLVLDLDHTLLNSARFSELTQEQHDGLHRVIAAWECREKGGDDAAVAAAARDALLPPPPPPGEEEKEKATATEEKEEKDAKDANEEKDEKEEREADDGDATPETYPGTSPPLAELRCLRPLCMFTKLRPRAREFLRAASAMCQLYVYTMGDKNYAREMAKILDPTGELFNGRVIANSDSTCSRTKDLDIVLGAEGSVLIVDDTDRVWPHNLANLIRIDRYHFFPQSAAGFRQPGRSVLERAWKDEGANGDREQLRDVLRVIATAHAAFFPRHRRRGNIVGRDDGGVGHESGDFVGHKSGDFVGRRADADADAEEALESRQRRRREGRVGRARRARAADGAGGWPAARRAADVLARRLRLRAETGATSAVVARDVSRRGSQVRSIHWSPYDPVGVVNADP